MMHSSTASGSTPARRTASATTSAPSCGAVKPLSVPWNFPVAVLTALAMTTSRTDDDLLDRVLAEERLHTVKDDGGRAPHFLPPLGRGRVLKQRRAFEAHGGPASHRRTDGGFPREVHLAGRERRVA